MSNSKKQQYFLGIDGGGSKCKAIIVAVNSDSQENEILGTGISGPGNPLHGFEQATNSIVESAKLALKDAGLEGIKLSEIIAGVGLAGVNLPILFEQMSAWQHPFKEMFLATDLLIACLGAHQGNDGAVIITGTGSCGFAYIDGKEFMLGAHGFPHGDKGSGAWFGLQAVKHVLLSVDGLVQPSIMNDVLLKKLDCKDEIALVEKIAGKPATYYAQLANLVFDAAELGDILAKNIVAEGAEYINSVARTLWLKNPGCMSMIGGLTPRLQPWLDEDIKAKLSKPFSGPEYGSILFAKQEMAKKVLGQKEAVLL